MLVEGLFFIGVTLPGHVPDIWAHVYRVDAILNGDIVARPVSSRSMLHNTENGVVGVAVNRESGCNIRLNNTTAMTLPL